MSPHRHGFPPPVPWRPESIDRLKARFPDAVAGPIDIDAACRGDCHPPGARIANVFDLPDGLRLIVSVDSRLGWRCPQLHVSASAWPGSWVFRSIESGEIGVEAFKRFALSLYAAISGDAEPLEFHGHGVTGAPHWFRELGPGQGGADA